MNKSDHREGAPSGTDTEVGIRLFFVFCLFWSHRMACGILIPWPGIEPGPTAVKGSSLNHWTAREFPDNFLKCQFRDFPGGPVGKTTCSQCRGPGSIPGRGTRSCTHAATKTRRSQNK